MSYSVENAPAYGCASCVNPRQHGSLKTILGSKHVGAIWSMTHIQMYSYFIHRYAAIFLHDGFNCCSGLWCHYWVYLTRRGESVTELMPFMNFLVHLYICCSDRHASSYWTFIRRWISIDFTPSLLKKRMIERCSSSVHFAIEAAIFTLLLRRRVAFLHITAACRPLFKPWVSLL